MSAPDRIWALSDIGASGRWIEKTHENDVANGRTEYTRLDPNTRIVTVDQLERWEACTPYYVVRHEIRAIIGEVK